MSDVRWPNQSRIEYEQLPEFVFDMVWHWGCGVGSMKNVWFEEAS